MPFKPFKVSITVRDPEEAQVFFEGLMIAQSNNNSPYFRELIDAVNQAMHEYRQEQIAAAGPV